MKSRLLSHLLTTPRKDSRLRDLAAFAGFLGAMFAARSSLADHYHVPTGSMIPTVAIGDRVVVNKLAYGFRLPFTSTSLAEWGAPTRGDVVVLTSPEDEKTTLLKRVVAVPGDEVKVADGHLWIGGSRVPVEGDVERLGRPHAIRPGGPAFGPRLLGKGEYLVMGDNRKESHDGRTFGLVPARAVLGRVVAVYWSDGPTWRPL